MPEGIVPELLIALGLVLVIVVIVLVARRRGPGDEEPTAPGTTEDRAEQGAEMATEDRAEPAAGVAEERPGGAVDTIEREPTAVEPPAPVEPPPTEVVRPRLRERLAKSRRALAGRLAEALRRGVDAETWDDLEAALIQADVGVDTATKIVAEVRDKARQAKVSDPDGVRALLVDEVLAVFDREIDRGLSFSPAGVTVWLVVGVNGTGKTTTIGKLAADLRMHAKNVALAAADTFRAAADEQLAAWAERAGAELIKHQPGADPGAVAFDAFQHARAQNLDVLIVDTAGRLHTKTPLMDELAKIRRVIEKEGDVQESLLVIDATAGQNGLVQAREFADATGVTGIVLTKLDGTAKGGIVLAIEETLGIPIKLIGVGEGIEDLEPFEPQNFVEALLA